MYSNELKIKGIIADRGPLGGVKVLGTAKYDKTCSLVQKLRTTSYINDFMHNQPVFSRFMQHLGGLVMKDLANESGLITDILNKLPNIDISLLLISCESDFLKDVDFHYNFTSFLPQYL